MKIETFYKGDDYRVLKRGDKCMFFEDANDQWNYLGSASWDHKLGFYGVGIGSRMSHHLMIAIGFILKQQNWIAEIHTMAA